MIWRGKLQQELFTEQGREIPIRWRRLAFAPVANDGVITDRATVAMHALHNELRARSVGRAMLAAASAHAIFNRRLWQYLDDGPGLGPAVLLEISDDVHSRDICGSGGGAGRFFRTCAIGGASIRLTGESASILLVSGIMRAPS